MYLRGRKKEVARENYTLRSVKILIPSQTFRVITSKKKGWVVHVACIGEKRNKHSFLVGNVKEKHLLRNYVKMQG